jgi:hypothetical protein
VLNSSLILALSLLHSTIRRYCERCSGSLAEDDCCILYVLYISETEFSCYLLQRDRTVHIANLQLRSQKKNHISRVVVSPYANVMFDRQMATANL